MTNKIMLNKKEESGFYHLAKFCDKVISPIVYYFGIEYEFNYEYIHHLIINFVIIYFIINIVNKSTSQILQLVLAICLVTYLIEWVCWMISQVLFYPNDEVKGGNIKK